jgi:acyl-CoA synthetase (NDP forming)
MSDLNQQLNYIFKPKSVAVIGASDRPGKWGFMMVDTPMKSGFNGNIYPVHPGGGDVLGLKGYADLLDVPGAVDLAVITVPAVKVAEVIKDCAVKGVKAAIIITAGFAEVGDQGRVLQDEVTKIAKDAGIRFVGPNCMGIWSSAANLNLCLMKQPTQGAVAFASQSGTYGVYLSEIAHSKGYGLSKFISIGNQADITAAEYLNYLAEDNDTKVIVFYIEGFKDGKHFFESAREVIKKKPIIIFKGGKTEAGARATKSHTASLAGSEEIYEAMCRQVGIINAEEAFQSFEMAEALVYQPLPRGKRIVILGSGGQGVVISDACAALGLEVPELDSATVNSLKKILPSHAPPPKNPVDFAGGYYGVRDQIDVIEQLFKLDYIDGAIANVPSNLSLQTTVNRTSESAEPIPDDIARDIEYFANIPKKYNKPIVTIRISRPDRQAAETILKNNGMPFYDTPEQCARAMYALTSYASVRNK